MLCIQIQALPSPLVDVRETLAVKYQTVEIGSGFVNGTKEIKRHYKGLNNLCKNGYVHEALAVMETQGVPLSRNNAYYLLQECSRWKDLDCCRRVQSLMEQNGLNSISILGDHLIRLYSSFKNLPEAKKAFKSVLHPTVYTWKAIISAHADLGYCDAALELYREMQLSGVKSNKFVYLTVLKACRVKLDLEQGKNFHDQIIKSGLESDPLLRISLFFMYAQCGTLEDTCKMFSKLQASDFVVHDDMASERSTDTKWSDTVAWSMMVASYVQHGKSDQAFDCFWSMQKKGIKANQVTFLNILRACNTVGFIGKGKLIHGQIVKSGVNFDIILGSNLVDMYCKCRCLLQACIVFNTLPYPDVVLWNTIIGGYAQHGEGCLALEFFTRMHQDGLKPNKVTYLSVLKACVAKGDIEQGRFLYKKIMQEGIPTDNVVGSCLIDMFSKCGSLREACGVFDELLHRDVVSWGAMIAGYAQHGKAILSLECFQKMQQENVKPDNVTFFSALKACGSVGAIEQGKLIHKQISEHGCHFDVTTRSALIDMYANGGSLKDAHEVFEKILDQNIISWNAMISAYAQHGEIVLAMECIEDMEKMGVKPDELTFISIVSACSRVGFVTEGCWYFRYMKELHGLAPAKLHYNCMVNLLGRAGYLKEAEELLRADTKQDTLGWLSLLGSCRIHHDKRLGVQCFNEITNLDSFCAAAYVLISNIFADDACMEIMNWEATCKRGAKKYPHARHRPRQE